MKEINRQIARQMLKGISNDKRCVLMNACNRNAILTSFYGLENATLAVYKEGFYLRLYGVRTEFKLWCFDNDGELIEGRKPKAKKLSPLYVDFGKTDEICDLYDLLNPLFDPESKVVYLYMEDQK